MKFFAGRKFKLSYETWGDPQHQPLVFFHGFPGSRVQAKALVPSIARHQVFLIATDRPGYGRSVGSGGAKDYLADLGALLTQLKATRFHLVGVSGGAPWAHLMASAFPDRVNALGVVCGLATYNGETAAYFSRFQNRALRVRRLLPSFASEMLVNRFIRKFNPEKKLRLFLQFLDESDRHVLSQPTNRDLLVDSMKEARSQSAKGIVFDSALYYRDWLHRDCDLKRLFKIPTFYFHGLRDRVLDHRMSQWMHKLLPSSRLQFFEKEGHYSLPFRHGDSILSSLLA